MNYYYTKNSDTSIVHFLPHFPHHASIKINASQHIERNKTTRIRLT